MAWHFGSSRSHISDPSDEYYVMRLSMAAMVARDHYERTSKKVTETLAEVRKDGTWCGRTPYGWMRIEDPTEARGNLGLVPDPDQAAILTTAATEHLRGVGLRRLGARFGLDPTNLGRILDRPETAWLIGQDLWDALQAMPKGQRSPQIHAYVFSGLIECGRCKKTLVGNNRKNRSGSLGRYYVCNGRVDHGDHGTNLRHTVVADAIRAQLTGTPLRQSDIAAVRALLSRAQEGPSMAELWVRRDRELEAQLDRLIDLHTSGGATREQFDRHAAKIAAERADLGPRPLPVARIDEAIEVVRSLDEVLVEIDSSDPEMVRAVNLVLRTVVDKIEYAEGKEARIRLREPFGRLINELRASETTAFAA